MEANESLKKHVMEVIDEQLRKNNPQATKEAFERLIATGCTKTEAKEAIAAILLENIWEMLKYKKHFDESEFAKKLSKLKGRH